MKTTSWPRATSSWAIPTAGGTLPPPSQVTKANRVMSAGLQDSVHHESDACFGVEPASPCVAPEKLPRVDIAGNHEGVEQKRPVLTSGQLRCKLALHRLAMRTAPLLEPLAQLGEGFLLRQVADHEVAHVLVVVEQSR